MKHTYGTRRQVFGAESSDGAGEGLLYWKPSLAIRAEDGGDFSHCVLLVVALEPALIYFSNSFSNSFRCRATISTIRADTEGLPPYNLLRLKATLFSNSHTSDGRLMPVVRWVRSMISGVRGVRLVVGGFGMAMIEFSAFDNRQTGGFYGVQVRSYRYRTDGQDASVVC